jgi:hypothetical protein
MNYSRQIQDDLLNEYTCLSGLRPNDSSKSRIPETRTSSPLPRTSSKSQIESLKISLDRQEQDRKVEQFKKQALENNRIMSQGLEDLESKSSPSTPDFCKEIKNKKNKFVRTDFPKSISSEFPFFDSPIEKKELVDFMRLTDERIGREETFDVIERLSKRQR